jgi:hypothetical protein
MKKFILFFLGIASLAFVFYSCQKTQTTPADPCAGLTISLDATTVNPTAAGTSDGSITVTATPTGTYTYSLNGGAFQSSNTFINLAAGSYTIKAKNADGCLSAEISKTLTNPNDPCSGVVITVGTSSSNPAAGASNGSITATASPAGNYQYSLNGGSTYQAENVFNNLAAGAYVVTAKNGNGCTGKSDTVRLTIAGNPCQGINIGITPTVVNANACATNGGKITITAIGSSGYTYQNGNGAFQQSNQFSNLTAGSYNITVKDANGCTASQSVTVGTDQAGPKFTAVKNLLTQTCSSCHAGNRANGGYSINNQCNIVSTWDRIQARCINQTPSAMPPPPSGGLSDPQKQTIRDWINAGHRYTD